MQLELLDQEEEIIRQLKQNYKDALAEMKMKVRKMKVKQTEAVIYDKKS